MSTPLGAARSSGCSEGAPDRTAEAWPGGRDGPQKSWAGWGMGAWSGYPGVLGPDHGIRGRKGSQGSWSRAGRSRRQRVCLPGF